MGKWINKVGVEIECAVSEVHDVDGFSVEHDGSLQSDDGRCREYVSDPHEYAGELSALRAGLEDLYPLVTEINQSMGLHVHVSLRDDYYYYALSSKRFHDFFIQRVQDSALYERNEALRDRVDHSDWAEKIQDPAVIDKMLGGSGKYYAVNYRKDKYDTLEFRLFPAMETPGDVMAAVELVTTTVNAYLHRKEYVTEAEEAAEVDPSEVVVNV